MSAFVKFILSLFLTILIISTIIGTLYFLHVKGIIHIVIPKRCRIACFKHYVSPAEKAAEAEEHARLAKIKQLQELTERLAAQPTEKGFKIDDSWFEKISEQIDFGESDERNPNHGVRLAADVVVDVFKNPDWPDEGSADDNASKKSKDSFSSRGLTGRGMGQ